MMIATTAMMKTKTMIIWYQFCRYPIVLLWRNDTAYISTFKQVPNEDLLFHESISVINLSDTRMKEWIICFNKYIWDDESFHFF